MRQLTGFRRLLPSGACLFALAGPLGHADNGVASSPTERQEAVHLLDRITFGPRPGDVERVEKMGLNNYLEQQLHPETIDDSRVEEELQQLNLMQMSDAQLFTLYDGERKKAQEKRKEQAAAFAAANTMAKPMDGTAPTMETPPMPPAAPVNGGPGRPDGKVLAALKGPHSAAIITQLEQDKLIRAVDSERQLQEVLVDFWTNHFNIDMRKGPCRALKVADDREVIRPHIFGRFRDLLEASAQSPAMLVYLDNAQSSAPRQLTARQEQFLAARMEANGQDPTKLPPPGQKNGGINENYAREIMELHTLGVDGGYTQKDVTEVARCFTGWTIDRQTGTFRFAPFRHDNGSKVVLGHVIPANGGMQDGETVLDILASSPATARFISRELCQRFVSDDPPESLVARVAAVFQHTDGDLRQVVKAILTSPEFLSPASFNAKIKSPLEFAVSAVRATESVMAPPDDGRFAGIRPNLEGAAILGRTQAADRLSRAQRQSLNWHIYELGEPLFACTAPTGYKEVSKIWVSPGALIERLNFAMALTQQKVADVRFDAGKVLGATDLDKPDAMLDRCATALLQGDISPSTRRVLDQAALPTGDSKTADPSKLIALVLGSPEFQRK